MVPYFWIGSSIIWERTYFGSLQNLSLNEITLREKTILRVWLGKKKLYYKRTVSIEKGKALFFTKMLNGYILHGNIHPHVTNATQLTIMRISSTCKSENEIWRMLFVHRHNSRHPVLCDADHFFFSFEWPIEIEN